MSKAKGQDHHGQKVCCAVPSPHGSDGMECACCKWCHVAADGTILSLSGPRGWFQLAACSLCLVKHL